MLSKRKKIPGGTLSPETGMGRMLILSLGLHLLVVLIFAGVLAPRLQRDLRPVYYVDLVNLPVKDPQAGRPDARPEPAKKPEPAPPAPAAPRPEPPPAKPEPPKPVPKAEAKPAVKAAPKPAPEPAPKPASKPAPKPAGNYEEALSAIDKLRREKERQDLREKLAALGAADSRQNSSAPEAPVGMPTGKGTQAGVDEQEWISAFIKQNWNLSKYQVRNRSAVVLAHLVYDPRGALIDYKVLRESGENIFDESVRRAILKAKQLPFQPERRLEIDVEFNLKDLPD